MTTLPQLVRQARENARMTQDELTQQLGMSDGYVAQLEAGGIKRPGPRVVEALERILGLSRADLNRAMGMLGPSTEVDLVAEVKRIAKIADLHEQAEALKQLPPDLVEAIERLVTARLRGLLDQRPE